MQLRCRTPSRLSRAASTRWEGRANSIATKRIRQCRISHRPPPRQQADERVPHSAPGANERQKSPGERGGESSCKAGAEHVGWRQPGRPVGPVPGSSTSGSSVGDDPPEPGPPPAGGPGSGLHRMGRTVSVMAAGSPTPVPATASALTCTGWLQARAMGAPMVENRKMNVVTTQVARGQLLDQLAKRTKPGGASLHLGHLDEGH